MTRAIPRPWTVQWDEAFFHIVCGLFSPTYLECASALLSSYDDLLVDWQPVPQGSDAPH